MAKPLPSFLIPISRSNRAFIPTQRTPRPRSKPRIRFSNKKAPPLSGVLVIRYFFSMRRFAASMVSVRVPFFISTFSPWKSSPVSSSSRPPISVPF